MNRNKQSLEDRLWSRVTRSPNGCWEWQGHCNNQGYGQIGVEGHRLALTHRVAWRLANNREIPDGLIIRHSCDNPPCCNPDHLLLGTLADNSKDALERGRVARGFRLPHTKLTDDQVREIRRRYGRVPTPPGERGFRTNRAALAAEFGVHPQYITDLVRRKERADV